MPKMDFGSTHMFAYIKHCTPLLLTISPFIQTAHAAAFDRSGQSINDFFQNGTYAQISYNYSMPHVSGQDAGLSSQGQPNRISNIANNTSSFRGSIKTDLDEKISLGLIYDQPFSIDLKHRGQTDFVSQFNNKPAESTQATLDSHNLTGLIGININKNFGIHAGPVLEQVKGEIRLRGQTYRGSANYNGELHSDYAPGFVAGLNFKKPEIGLKAALTYRSEIKHESRMTEQFTALNSELYTLPITFTSPESVNLDFQTGLSPKTLLTASVRWVPWEDFELKPTKLAERTAPVSPDKTGLPLLSYEKDQWSAQIGVAQKLNNKFSVSTSLLWDGGLGDPANALGPVNGYWGAGLGFQYNLTPEWAVSVAGRYLWIGDAKAKRQNGDIVGSFADNNTSAIGLRLSYQKKPKR